MANKKLNKEQHAGRSSTLSNNLHSFVQQIYNSLWAYIELIHLVQLSVPVVKQA